LACIAGVASLWLLLCMLAGVLRALVILEVSLLATLALHVHLSGGVDAALPFRGIADLASEALVHSLQLLLLACLSLPFGALAAIGLLRRLIRLQCSDQSEQQQQKQHAQPAVLYITSELPR
jgi:hypothetical protein